MGFFQPDAWQQVQQPLALLPDCERCGLYHHCHSPRMPVSGEGRRKVLLVGEGPGKTEDERGYQFCGSSGLELMRLLLGLGISMRKDCWLTNALICHPKDEHGENRDPTNEELICCRPNLAKTLRELEPNVIVPLGVWALKQVIALSWRDGEVSDMGSWAGFEIPSQKLNSWIVPTYHPSFLLHTKNAAAELHVREHLKRAFAKTSKPWPHEKPDYDKQLILEMNPQKAAFMIRKEVIGDRPIAFDYETTTLKPDGRHARILCCSVSDGLASMAFPWQEPAISAMKEFFLSNTPKIAANLDFEDRWTRKHVGVCVRNWHWDTLLGAHWLNCRARVGLKFQAFVLLGAEDYDSHIDGYKKSVKEGSNNPNRMAELEPLVMLKYCAMDSLLERLVAQIQMETCHA